MLLSCPACERKLKIPDTAAGKKIACPKCKQTIQVPRKPTPPVDDEDDDGLAPNKSPAEVAAYLAEIQLSSPAEVKKLGAPIDFFKVESFSKSVQIIIVVLGVLLSLLGIGVLVGILLDKVGSEAVTAVIFLLLAGVALIGVGLYLLLRSHAGVVAYRGGLLHIQGKDTTVIRWEDITEVWQSITDNYVNGIHTGTTFKYTIELEDGDEFVYDNSFPRVKPLGELIQEKVTGVLLPRMSAAYKKGESLEFGPLAVDKKGLTCQGYSLRWKEIEALKLEAGQFVILKKGKWLSWGKVAAADVPNVFVFLALTDRILGTSIQGDSFGPSAADGESIR
jgi:hypothetical protein